MENSTPENISYQLLSKYFANECTAEERSIIEEWEAAGNKRRLAELKMVWLDTGIIPNQQATTDHKFDVDKAWNRFKDDVIEFPEPKAIPFNPVQRMLQIAAVIIAVVGGSILFNIFSSPDIQMQTLASNTEAVESFLPDSSKIQLNKNSTIEYPEKFAGNKREVKLKGEAFFAVEHNPDKPFIINAGDAQITVLGTSFNVEAYDNQNITVAVETGKVSLKYLDQEIILTPGMVGVYEVETKKVIENTAPAPDISYWRDKTLNFKSTSLLEVIKLLNDTYEVNISLANENLATCNLSASFADEELDTILELISTALNVKVEKDGEQIILQGDGCE